MYDKIKNLIEQEINKVALNTSKSVLGMFRTLVINQVKIDIQKQSLYNQSNQNDINIIENSINKVYQDMIENLDKYLKTNN